MAATKGVCNGHFSFYQISVCVHLLDLCDNFLLMLCQCKLIFTTGEFRLPVDDARLDFFLTPVLAVGRSGSYHNRFLPFILISNDPDHLIRVR